MSHGLMEGMLWATLVMAGVPLLIGIGVGIVLMRRRAQGKTSAEIGDAG